MRSWRSARWPSRTRTRLTNPATRRPCGPTAGRLTYVFCCGFPVCLNSLFHNFTRISPEFRRDSAGTSSNWSTLKKSSAYPQDLPTSNSSAVPRLDAAPPPGEGLRPLTEKNNEYVFRLAQAGGAKRQTPSGLPAKLGHFGTCRLVKTSELGVQEEEHVQG